MLLLLFLLRKFQEFGELWARNHGRRPNIHMRNIFWSSKVQLHIRIIWGGGKGILKNMNVCSKQILEKAMAPHSSTLAWKIPWMGEPGALQSMGSRRVRHDWMSSLSLFTSMHWRRKWHPTPVFLPGESQGRGSLVGCHLWGRTESDTTEAT